MTTNSTYQSLLDSLVETDTVVCISAGNNGYWAENSQSVAGTLYGDDVNFHTGGSPAPTPTPSPLLLWITTAPLATASA